MTKMAKKAYQKPAVRSFGDIRSITLGPKTFGFFDGDWLVTQDNPLKNLS
jgi:hypothetical protein